MESLSIIVRQVRSFNRSARLFLIATVLDGIILNIWWLYFNFFILGRGFDRAFLGLVNSVPSVAALLLGLPLGMLLNSLGYKRAMLLGVSIYLVAAGIEVTVLQPTLIVSAAFISGAANTLWFLSQAPFMMRVSTEENRTLLFSLNFGLITLSGALGNLIAGQLPQFWGNILHVPADSVSAYQAVLLMALGLSALTLIPLGLIHETQAPLSDPQSTTPAVREVSSLHKPMYLQVLRCKITWQLSLPNLLIGFGASILIPYMNVFFNEKFAISDQLLGTLFSLSAVLTGSGTLVGPRLAEEMGSKIRVVVLTQSFSLIFLLLTGFSPLLPLAGGAFLLRAMLMNMATPLYSAFAMEQVHASEQGVLNSVKELAWQVGWAVGPYLSGVIQERYGFSPLFISTSVLYAISACITWWFFNDKESAP